MVTMRLVYVGEDERYIKLLVGSKTLKIAKSRVQYVLDDGDVVLVTMTQRYANSRPELATQ